LSKPEIRKWWLNTYLNATKFANGDDCFCDSSQRETTGFTPSPSAVKQKAWDEGMLNLAKEALGDDKLVIGKVANQSYVKDVQIKSFRPSNSSTVPQLL